MLRPYRTRDGRFDNDFVTSVLAIQSGPNFEDSVQNNHHKSSNISPQSILFNDYDDLNDSSDSGQDQTNSLVNPKFPPDLTADQRQDLDSLLDKYAGLFSSKPGLTNLGTHTILVKPTIKPVKCHPYLIHPSKRKSMRDEGNSLLDLGLIRPSESCFASPCMLVDKPNGNFPV